MMISSLMDASRIFSLPMGEMKNVPINRKRVLVRNSIILPWAIHKPEIICNRMVYAGSPFPLDKMGQDQGYIIGEISNGEERKTDYKQLTEYKSIIINVNQI